MINKIQAVGLLRTWLNACNIDNEINDGEVFARNGEGSRVRIETDFSKIMSTNLDTCMEEFHAVTEKLGYGKPMPVNRGKAAKKRIFDDTILARWRHTEMRTVPNQPDARLRALEFIAKREACIFTGRNRHLCLEMGYDVDVAINDALIWTNTFLGRYSLEDETGTRKLLTNYLRQRFIEQKRGLDRERRSVIPPGAWFIANESEDTEEDLDYKEEHDQLKAKSPAQRKARAGELLNASFKAIGHDSMVARLKETIESHPCEDTKRAANRYLKKHVEECEACKATAKTVAC